ncbi:hypothetical protein PG987_006698 [Apiospora arundinis]
MHKAELRGHLARIGKDVVGRASRPDNLEREGPGNVTQFLCGGLPYSPNVTLAGRVYKSFCGVAGDAV